MLMYSTWNNERVNRLQNIFKDSLDVLKWAYSEYSDEILYACSFGAEGIVLIDLISKVKKDARIVFLDTDLHFKETYLLIDEVNAKYSDLQIESVKPLLTVKQQAERYGDRLWERAPDHCCHLRKIEPLSEQLNGVSAWISGLRREQSLSRRQTNYINKDEKFQSIKICPLIDWTWKEIWTYIELHELPYNILHDKGYPSIGCEKCTVPASNSEDFRSGRWANSEKTECGLHESN
ncbi:phosphoadenylyl-sulfate reductase [Pueribacillus sp. YX66]|uniref:phosphoadenylyl-sulfate reductase n=1 Tax=Pueribacillus sp. YX66 TaxID=3229242 RepID=UPI0036D3AFBA